MAVGEAGVPLGPLPQDQPSIRREAAEAFFLFSNDSRSFRTDVVKQTLIAVSVREKQWTRKEPVGRTAGVLGLNGIQVKSISAAVDSLLQEGSLSSPGGAIQTSQSRRELYERTRAIVGAEYASMVRDVQGVLTSFLPSRADPVAAAAAVAAQLGRILTAYRDFQAAVAAKDDLASDVRTAYTKQLERAKATLLQEGVPAADVDRCSFQLSTVADSHAVFAGLSAGAVFQRLAQQDKPSLVAALGGAGTVAVR